jgi:hypothetical protein
VAALRSGDRVKARPSIVLEQNSAWRGVTPPFRPVLSYHGRGLMMHEPGMLEWYCDGRGSRTFAPEVPYDPRAGDLIFDGGQRWRVFVGLFSLEELVRVSARVYEIEEAGREVTALDFWSRHKLRYLADARRLEVKELERVSMLNLRGSKYRPGRRGDRVSREEWLALRRRLLAP